jgi:hypothetical protein
LTSVLDHAARDQPLRALADRGLGHPQLAPELCKRPPSIELQRLDDRLVEVVELRPLASLGSDRVLEPPSSRIVPDPHDRWSTIRGP